MKHIDWSFKPDSALDDEIRRTEEHHELIEQDFLFIEWDAPEMKGQRSSHSNASDSEDEMEQWLADAIAEEEERLDLEGFAEQEYLKDLANGLIEPKRNEDRDPAK